MKKSLSTNRVTVVIPAFRAAATLRQTVSSCINQSLVPKIIILVNGSDETFAVAKSIQNENPNAMIEVFEPGVAVLPVEANWTRAIKSSDSEYVKLLCADDVLHADAIQKQVDFLDANPTCAFVGSKRSIVTSGNKVLIKSTGGFGLKFENSFKRTFISCLLKGTNTIGEPSAVLFRSVLVFAEMPWDATRPYVIDLELYLRILKNYQMKCGFINEVLCDFRIATNAWSTSLANRQANDFSGLLHQYLETRLQNIFLAFVLTLTAKMANLGRLLIYKLLRF